MQRSTQTAFGHAEWCEINVISGSSAYSTALGKSVARHSTESGAVVDFRTAAIHVDSWEGEFRKCRERRRIKLSFGLGIIPVMLVTGAGLSLATIGIRRKLIRVAAVSVVTSIGES